MSLAERADLIVDFTNVPAGTLVPPAQPRPRRAVRRFPPRRRRMRPRRGRSWSSASVRRPARIQRRPSSCSCRRSPRWSVGRPGRWHCSSARRLSGMVPRRRSSGRVRPLDRHADRARMGRTHHREPGRRRNRGVGALQLHGGRAPDPHPRDPLPGGQSAGPRSRQPSPPGPFAPPEVWETGFKDTVISYPGEVTRVRGRFDVPGLFVWHCHIVEHEDNEMMRAYAVGRSRHRPVDATSTVEGRPGDGPSRLALAQFTSRRTGQRPRAGKRLRPSPGAAPPRSSSARASGSRSAS